MQPDRTDLINRRRASRFDASDRRDVHARSSSYLIEGLAGGGWQET
jgi:hypothetical protein